MQYTMLDTPIGTLMIAGDEAGLRRIDLPRTKQGRVATRAVRALPGDWVQDAGAMRDAAEQIAAYFAGELREFDLRLATEGTAFQRRCWAALGAIPYGRTISYGEQARRLGDGGAARAVGAANGANPLPIVVPCHRVIGADGSLVGFGGGLDVKRMLIEHEAAHAGLFAALTCVDAR